MASTRCTCLREGDLSLLVQDPLCAAPSHLNDEMVALGKELGIS